MDAKFTTKAQEALGAAIQHATAAGNPQLEPAHVLSALLEQEGGVANGLLDAVGADRATLGRQVRAMLVKLPASSGASVSQPSASRQTVTALDAAEKEARALGDDYVSTEHLLIGLATGQSGIAEALTAVGASRDALVAALPTVRGNARVTSPNPEGMFKALEQYGVDLTQQARDGKLDPVIGRQAEIRPERSASMGQSRSRRPARSVRSFGSAALPASITSAWLRGSGAMPAPRLVTSEMPSTSRPASRAAMVSSVVDMPTRSPPRSLAIRTSAGVSYCGPQNWT